MVQIALPAPVYNWLRTILQAAYGLLVGHFTILAAIPMDTAVNWALTVVVIGGVAALVHWLQTRTGSGFWPRAARAVARLAMLGLGTSPTYPPAATPPAP